MDKRKPDGRENMSPGEDRRSGRDRRYNAPFERAFYHVKAPFEELISHKATRGIVLLVATIMALVAMNTALSVPYLNLINMKISLRVGAWELEEALYQWVNDGLMGIFFLAVGLEIKKELLIGELSTPRKAVLPLIGALGGMIVPAVIFLALNPHTPESYGWAIPVATDIAFVIGALTLLGDRAPRPLYVFLITLAIVDDLGAVTIIAIFYTKQIAVPYLVKAAALMAILVAFNMVGVRKPLPYLLVGALLWFAMLKSGVHATLAGILVAVTIPARSKTHPVLFTDRIRQMIASYDSFDGNMENPKEDDHQHSIIKAVKKQTSLLETPLHRTLDELIMPVAFIVLPVFAFVNAGVPLSMDALAYELTHPLTIGVVAGLALGKFIGVSGSCLLAVRFNLASLPAGMETRHVLGGSILAGIGFTMSMFIAGLAFRDMPDMHQMAKTGIITGSLIAGVIGFAVLYLLTDDPRQKHGEN